MAFAALEVPLTDGAIWLAMGPWDDARAAPSGDGHRTRAGRRLPASGRESERFARAAGPAVGVAFAWAAHTVSTAAFLQMMADLTTRAPAGYEFSREEVDLMLGGNSAGLLGLG